LAALAAADPRVKVIFNARNFGPFRSAFNGITATSGDAVLLMLAVDLQDPPELLPEFVRLWEAGNEVVVGVRQEREEGWLLRRVRRLYYRPVGDQAGVDVPLARRACLLADRCAGGARGGGDAR